MHQNPELKTITPSNFCKQKLQTPSGTIHSIWEEKTPFTSNGFLPFFSEYLHAGGIFEDWVSDCPLEYKSNNAPEVADLLGTATLSILSGHTRYSHMASLFGDTVAAEIMGLDKIVSHDSLGRALYKMDEAEATSWMQKHLIKTYEALLKAPYILDMDPTVKPIYGHQEGAAKGYNPTKPGRPSLCYHTYFVANLRLLLDVDVRPGNETAGCYSHNRLWSLLDSLPIALRPTFIRGDIAFGNEGTMCGCEDREVDYLFKLRQSPKVKILLEELTKLEYEWTDAGQGWKSFETSICLQGWTKERRIIVYRRQKNTQPTSKQKKLPAGAIIQPEFSLCLITDEAPEYEYFVLVTSLDYSPEVLGQLYRDRADCENALDELKNQWGWGGFTSRELKQTQLMARIVALIYNWWNIFCRLAKPEKHMEAKTSRPALQQIIGRLVSTGRQKIIHLCATGEKADWAQKTLTEIATFLGRLLNATQLNKNERWCCILTRAFSAFLKDYPLQPIDDGKQMLLLLS